MGYTGYVKYLIVISLSLLFLACPPAVNAEPSVAEINMLKMTLNNAESYLDEGQILPALEAVLQAEKMKIPGERLNEVLGKVLAKRKEMADQLFQKATMAMNDQKMDKAIFFLRQIVEFWPDNEDALGKLKKLGVELKDLTLRAQRDQEEEVTLLQRLQSQSRDVEAALADLKKLEEEYRIRDALTRAEEILPKFKDNPALNMKVDQYRSAVNLMNLLERCGALHRAGRSSEAVPLAEQALKLDPGMKLGLFSWPRDRYTSLLTVAGSAAVTTGNTELRKKIDACLGELGSIAGQTWLAVLTAYGNQEYRQALTLLKNLDLLAKGEIRDVMDIGSLQMRAFMLNYKMLLIALAVQIVVFSVIGVKTFVLADMISDHALTRTMLFKEREIGYYIALCGNQIAEEKWRRAERTARYILGRNPSLTQCALWQGICRYRLGDRKAAEQLLRTFIRQAPRNPEAHFYLGLIEDELNHPQKAIEHLELARGISGAARDFELAEIRFKGEKYYRIYKEYRDAAAEVLGIKG